MIITTDNIQQQYPARGPWWQRQNVPPGHQNHQVSGNYWTQPIILVQQPIRTDENQPFTTPQTPEIHNNNDGGNKHNNNDNNKPHTTPNYHGGEGLIDIRLG